MGIFNKLKSIIFKSKKSKIISIIILVVVIAAAAGMYTKAQSAKIKEVTAVKVTKGILTQSVTITGTVEANDRNEIALSPASKVVQVLVKEGQAVKKGDILVKLDDAEYKNQLEKQTLNLAGANSTLRYLNSSGTQTDRSASESAMGQAEITLQNAKANLDDANKKYEQSKVLYDHGYISKNELDAAQKAVADCGSAVSGAEIALSNARTTYSNIDASTGEKLNNQRNQIALIQADIKYLNSKIDQCSLKANVSGIVTRLDAVEGQYPNTGDMVIVDETSAYGVSLDVSQYDSVKVQPGDKAKIKIKGVDKEYNGVVAKVGQLAEKSLTSSDQDAKVKIKVSISDPDENIKVGYEADADIILDEKQNALQISFEAVQDEKNTGKKYVYVIGTGNKIEKRYIETGMETDYNIEIKSGLKEGEKCVSNPDKSLTEGVTVKEAGGTK